LDTWLLINWIGVRYVHRFGMFPFALLALTQIATKTNFESKLAEPIMESLKEGVICFQQ
jgi:hypothetical protein